MSMAIARCTVLITGCVLTLAPGQRAATQEAPALGDSGLRRIAVVPPGLPERAVVVLLKSASDSLGLFGLAAEIKRGLDASKELSAELASGGLDYRTYLPARLADALRGAGFEVTMLSGARSGGDNFRFMARPPSGPTEALVLDVYAPYLGYSAESAHAPYRALVQLQARVLRPESTRAVFETKIDYGRFTLNDLITLEPDTTFSFPDRSAMKTAPAEVTQGLRSAIDAAVAELVRQLQSQI